MYTLMATGEAIPESWGVGGADSSRAVVRGQVMESLSDLELLTLWVEHRDQQAANCLVQRYWDRLVARARRRLPPGPQDDACDIVNQIFLEVFTNAARILEEMRRRGETSLQGYLLAAVYRRTAGAYRRHQTLPDHVSMDGAWDVAGDDLAPLSGMLADEERRELDSCLGALSPEESLIVIRRAEGHTLEAIGEEVGSSAASICRKYPQIIRRLRDRMADADNECR